MFTKHIFVYIAVFIPLVVAWTIDLPEVRRHLFDRNQKKSFENFGIPGQLFYDNIDGNSEHNSEEEHMKYGNGYGYHFDVEKNVASIAQDGGRYLEGLRRSIESYIGILTNCTRMNLTLSGNSTWRPPLEVPNMAAVGRASCVEVTRAGERVRRLAELALWATRRLQDLAYAELYQQDVSEEEDELIFRLASFLDRLAQLTGFRPDPKKFLEQPVSTTTPSSLVANMMANPLGTPENVKNALIRCLKQESTEPATLRCAYPLPIPPAVAQLFNINDTTTSSPEATSQTQSPSEVTPTTTTGVTQATAGGTLTTSGETQISRRDTQSSEILVGSDSSTFTASESRNSASKSLSLPTFKFSLHKLTKRSINTVDNYKILHKKSVKRSIDENPTINLMKYYVKHHVWANSNPEKSIHKNINPDNFDVKNDLTVRHVEKRSLFRRNSPSHRVPEHNLRLMKERIKATIGTHFFKNREQMLKLKNTLDSLRSISYKKSVTKAKIHKRSIHYEDMFLPRPSEDPTQDLSYYVKYKPGTDISPNVVQAAQVRLGLEQVFQTGSIEVVRRYGANYNPLVPAPFYAGVARSVADI